MSNVIIGVKITPEDRTLLDKVCKERGEDLSSFIRRAVKKELASLSYYPDETKKALGLIAEKEVNRP